VTLFYVLLKGLGSVGMLGKGKTLYQQKNSHPFVWGNIKANKLFSLLRFLWFLFFMRCGERPIILLRGHSGSKTPAGFVDAKREVRESSVFRDCVMKESPRSGSMNEAGLEVLLHPPFTNNRANEVSEIMPLFQLAAIQFDQRNVVAYLLRLIRVMQIIMMRVDPGTTVVELTHNNCTIIARSIHAVLAIGHRC